MSKGIACPCEGGTLDRLIQPAILVVLADGPLHGYGLTERIAALPGFSGNKPDVSGVYRFLKTMEGKGLVESSWDFAERGPARQVVSDYCGRRKLPAAVDQNTGGVPRRNCRAAPNGAKSR